MQNVSLQIISVTATRQSITNESLSLELFRCSAYTPFVLKMNSNVSDIKLRVRLCEEKVMAPVCVHE